MQGVVWVENRVLANKGAEGETAGLQVRAVQTYTVRMRYEAALAALAPEWRLVVGGSPYRIKAVDNVAMRNREFKLECVADV